MKPIIKVENLSKQYRLGTIGTGTLSNDLKRWWHKVRGKDDPFLKIGESNDRTTKSNSEYVWALKDINFEVMPGEILGILGKNGAGKSTLLKILSKVTGPTTGSISYNGRIGSLLEVGTGFHPELTGRENIFLNGAILGMTKKEIRSKLDEIIEFSGCERYIDTPVKRYSSGMTVRLGFAVAAHLEPEILVVDEVLAVGDAEFQKKAIGKMQDVSRNEGRTVLFVSHNLEAIKNLCKKGIIIKNGKIFFAGETEEATNKYIFDNNNLSGEHIDLENCQRETFLKKKFFTKFKFKNFPIRYGQNLDFLISIKSNDDFPCKNLEIGIGIYDINQRLILHLSNKFIRHELTSKPGNQIFQIEVENCLAPGIYFINLFLRVNEEINDWLQNIIQFEILEGNPYGFTNTKLIKGVIYPKYVFREV